MAGVTSSTDFPGTAGGAQPAYGGGYSDAFLARLTADLKGGICPATAALEGAPQKEAKLSLLYDVRDQVLATTNDDPS